MASNAITRAMSVGYTACMEWNVEGTDQFSAWFVGLDEAEDRAVAEAIDALAVGGPGLGRPLVDTVKGSPLPNLKELRPLRHNIRILFAFDPRRTAILLLGGSKTTDWQGWYTRSIPEALARYRVYLDELTKEGLL